MLGGHVLFYTFIHNKVPFTLGVEVMNWLGRVRCGSKSGHWSDKGLAVWGKGALKVFQRTQAFCRVTLWSVPRLTVNSSLCSAGFDSNRKLESKLHVWLRCFCEGGKGGGRGGGGVEQLLCFNTFSLRRGLLPCVPPFPTVQLFYLSLWPLAIPVHLKNTNTQA